jgi:hypothetical protein
MDTASVRAAFSITPQVEGRITFEDSQYRMRFRPNITLDAATTYTVRLDKSAQHPGNVGMDEDFVFTFTTKDRNRLVMLEGYPYDGAERVHPISPIFRYVFDRRLDPQSWRTGVRVFDNNGTELSISSRSLRNNNAPAPYGDFQFELGSNLLPDRTYRIVIDGEIEDEAGIMMVYPIEITFTTANAATNHGTIIEDFNVANRFVFDAESSSNATGASIARNTTAANRLFGSSSYRVRATFTDENAYAVYRAVPRVTAVHNGQVIGLHILGDMSRNEVHLLFSGSDEQEYSVKLCDLDFVGWRFVEASLASLPQDGQLTLDGIKVVRGDGILSGILDIYLDNMLLYNELLFPSGTPEITFSQIVVYPNPVSDVLFVRTESNEIPLLQIYSFGGHLLKEAKANEISVSDLSTGTYILSVKTGTETHRKPVIVVR